MSKIKTHGKIKYKINNTNATFKLDKVMELDLHELEIAEKLHPRYIDAMKEAPNFLPSIQLILGKAKFFNDGSYATIETCLERGLGNLEKGKTSFLKNTLKKLVIFREKMEGFAREVVDCAIVYMATGMRFRDEEVDIPEELNDIVKEQTKRFIGDKARSKPIGFYTWTETLKKIFTSDRFYQQNLSMSNNIETGAAILITYIISEDRELSEQHKTIVDTYQKITNPISAMTVWDYQIVLKKFSSIVEVISSSQAILRFKEALRKTKAYKEELEKEKVYREPEEHIGLTLFPYSQSKETELFYKLGIIPRQISLMDTLVKRIRSGEICLQPDINSGWYGYQQYALETLLLEEKAMEAEKLVMGEEYKEHLKEAFKGIFTKTRETHVKQLEMYLLEKEGPSEERIEIKVRPELCIEPTATIYIRIAKGYEFIRRAIRTVLGEDALINIHRMRENGSRSEKLLSEELNEMIRLLYGLYLKSCNDLGMKPELDELSETQKRAVEQTAIEFLRNLDEDDDLKKDTRVIVPVYVFPHGEQVCWATLGVRLMKINVEYDKRPSITILSGGKEIPSEEANIDIHFSGADYWIPVDVYSEVMIGPEPLTRKEFRQICDQCTTKEEVIKILAARAW